MLHLFSPHYSMGLNITNEMNICTFFHGVSAFREFHSFIVFFFSFMYMYLVHTTTISFLSLTFYIGLEGARAIVVAPIAYVFVCQCVRQRTNIFFPIAHIFFRGFVTYVVVTVYISYVILAEIRATHDYNTLKCTLHAFLFTLFQLYLLYENRFNHTFQFIL